MKTYDGLGLLSRVSAEKFRERADNRKTKNEK